MIEDDEELAELERRMRRKLDVENYKKGSLSEGDLRVAERLMGRENAQRRQNWQGDRPFRPKPVSIHYEYHWMPGGAYGRGEYVLVRVENGRRSDHEWKEATFDAEVARLRAAGYEVRHVMTEREKFEAAQIERRLNDPSPRHSRPPRQRFSNRYTVLNRLKDFKL